MYSSSWRIKVPGSIDGDGAPSERDGVLSFVPDGERPAAALPPEEISAGKESRAVCAGSAGGAFRIPAVSEGCGDPDDAPSASVAVGCAVGSAGTLFFSESQEDGFFPQPETANNRAAKTRNRKMDFIVSKVPRNNVPSPPGSHTSVSDTPRARPRKPSSHSRHVAGQSSLVAGPNSRRRSNCWHRRTS